ncbi:MAG: (Fe-S)-binding protein [Chloroflexota bacterium]|nr:(Fe-S)-binding protein [Chloroflexota bacterium]
MSAAEREIFWNIGHAGYALYFLLIPIAAVLVYGVWKRYRLWRLGQPDARFSSPWKSLWAFAVTGVVDGVIHRRFVRDLYPGLLHFFIFVGAIAFLLAAFLDFLSHYFLHFMHGATYLGISLTVDLLGLFLLLATIVVIYRRYIQKPDRLDNKPENAIALALVAVIVITGFIIEGVRIAYFTANPAAFAELFPEAGAYNPAWAAFSPGGWVTAKIFAGLSTGALLTTHAVFWWTHMIIVVGAIMYVALTFSSLSHIVVAPLNVFFRSMRPKGALVPLDLEAEDVETFGVSRIDQFTWKQILDLDACTRCGRCQDNCPAYLSGKALNPKELIQKLKTHWLEVGPDLVKAKKNGNGAEPEVSLIGDVITPEEIWDCTTCRACQEVCPVFIEHIDKIIDMRRNLVLEQAEMPETAEVALRCIEERGHTCKGTTYCRTDWAEGLDAKLLSDDQDVELVYFVGCAACLEDRNLKVSAAFGRLLTAAGINFATLGEEESCCGEPARRMGNEYLFQMQAMKNIETLNGYGVKKIVTTCPHCFNTLKNEYPQFGGNFEVIHHTQLIADLVKKGKLKLASKIDKKVTYQDPCYLLRYNDVYEAPRDVLVSIPKLKFTEMKRENGDLFQAIECKLLNIPGADLLMSTTPFMKLRKYYRAKNTFCCGAGGGHMWMEESVGNRINEMRTGHAMSTGSDVVATSCPYCLQMFEDGIRAREATEYFKAMDIAELVDFAIQEELRQPEKPEEPAPVEATKEPEEGAAPAEATKEPEPEEEPKQSKDIEEAA